MEEIKLKILQNGEVKIEVKGVQGPRCLELTKLLEDELGLVTSRIKSQDYYTVSEAEVVRQYSSTDKSPKV